MSIATNKKAFHDFEILEKYESGIILVGCEVKSIRSGKVNLAESYAKFLSDGSLWLVGCHISPYLQGNRENTDPTRSRKLLLHKKEIEKIKSKSLEKHLAIVPLNLYFKRNKVKLEIGLGKPKKLYDKRETLRKKSLKRDIDRELKRY